MQRLVKFGTALCVALVLFAFPQAADAHLPRSEACGVVVHKERVPGGVSTTPWYVGAQGLPCAKAARVAKDVAKAYAKSPGKRWQVSGWACVDKSGWVVPGQYGQSRIVCKKASYSVTLSWGA
jgi:hypothetical protein